jgi:hypothetical protein
MIRIVTMAALLAAGTALSASGANAAMLTDCINGYQELGNGVFVACDPATAPRVATEEPGTFEEQAFPEEPTIAGEELAEPLYAPPPGAPEEPLYTGSISAPAEEPLYTGSIPEPVPAVRESLMVANPSECQPGHYWMMSSSDSGGNRVMACP